MKTSYFGNIRNIRNPLSISQSPPRWYLGPQYKTLAPPWELVNRASTMAPAAYQKEFDRLVLSALDPRAEYDAIVKKYGEDVVLMCFEKIENPGDFCHRRYVAEWFEAALGVTVPEWEPPPKVRSTLSW